MMLATLLTAAAAYGAPRGNGYLSTLEDEIREYISQIDARIGVAAIINGADTIEVNGRKEFPMMSVFKFPLALTVAHIVETKGETLDSMITVSPDDLKANTYSPMLKKYGRRPLEMSLRELLEWSLKESDNNACDVLIDRIGGTTAVSGILDSLGVGDEIRVKVTEAQMHVDPSLSLKNSSTPRAMARLFERYDSELRDRSANFREIGGMLEQCRTGLDRLPAPFEGSDAIIGHKTGTGFATAGGGISAINDCGYIIIPDGARYYIAVFISNSPDSPDDTSKIIAGISEIVKSHFTSSNLNKDD